MKKPIRMIRQTIKKSMFCLQKGLLLISYQMFNLFYNSTNIWIIGVDEIAAYIHNMSMLIPGSICVSLSRHSFYHYEYTHQINTRNGMFYRITRIIYGPLLLGYLASRADNFCYIWHTGFLSEDIDGRAFEFSFLKRRNKKIVCMFLGNDIRSPKLMLDFAKLNEIEVISSYDIQIAPMRLTEEYELSKKLIAEAADQYADLIYSAPDDQKSYLKRNVEPIFYVYPDEKFYRNTNKYSNINKIRIVHAPSSPILKGTPLVRAAIKKLKVEGYSFDYIELTNVSNDQVLTELREAHIVLNQFYGFALGFFAIEALASYCAVLSSAHFSLESSLPKDSEDAWLSTQYWEVYDKLKYLLDNPHQMEKYASRGYYWAQKHYSFSNVKGKFTGTFSNNG